MVHVWLPVSTNSCANLNPVSFTAASTAPFCLRPNPPGFHLPPSVPPLPVPLPTQSSHGPCMSFLRGLLKSQSPQLNRRPLPCTFSRCACSACAVRNTCRACACCCGHSSHACTRAEPLAQDGDDDDELLVAVAGACGSGLASDVVAV